MGATEKNGDQYVFSSAPSVPREKTPDILVRFQAVSRERPCLRSTSVFLSSKSSLLEVRKVIHRTFAPCYEKGFIFLRRNKEVVRSRERILRLFDILPRPPPKVQNDIFKYPNIQYKKLSYEKSGRRYSSMCCGLVFLYEDSGLSHWIPDTLQAELSAPTVPGFDYIPWSITSARPDVEDVSVDSINELAALGKEKELSKVLDSLPHELESRQLKDSRLATPLHYAAQNGYLGVCEILIGRLGREMLYMKNINKQTPLHCALTYGKFEDGGFERRKSNEDGRLSSKFDVVSYLLQLGPDLQCQDIHGLNCYRIFFTLGNKAVEEILQRTDLSLLDERVILHLTCYVLQYKMLDYARELCKLVKVFDPVFYRPPLHLAAEIGEKELVESLINRSERSDDTEETNANEMQSTNEDGEEKMTEKPEMTENHDPSEKDLDGHLPYHYACQHGRDTVIPLLYYDKMSDEDFTKGISLAIKWKQTTALQAIVKVRDLFFLDDNTKQMIIHAIEASLSSDPEYSRSLMPYLKSEIKVLIRFVSQVSRVGDLEALRWLAEQDVDLQHADVMGRTPLHEAAEMGHSECINFLLEKMVDPNAGDWRGATPLHYACMAGKVESVNVLLKCDNIVPNPRNRCGRTPLLTAAHRRQRSLLKVLVTEHLSVLDPHAVDMNKRSIIHYLYLMDLETAECLLRRMGDILPVEEAKPQVKAVPSFVTLCEIWRDQTLELKEKERKLSSQSLKSAKMRCKQCGRVWTIQGNRIRWFHKCKLVDKLETGKDTPAEDTGKQSQKRDKEQKATYSKKEDCEEIETAHGPFQPFISEGNHALPVPNILVMNKRDDILKLMTNLCPEILQKFGLQSLLLTAYQWNLECLKTLVMFFQSSQEQLSTLLHVACLQKPSDINASNRQIDVVKYLLNEEASPNHIPQKEELLSLLNITSAEQKVLYFSPLELAAIQQNKELVEVLVKNGASSSICFATHLAILNGDCTVLEQLLKERTTEGESIRGNIQNIDEHWRVCSLGMGLLQALCNSQNVSIKLVQCIMKLTPDILQSKKILTRNMISEIRPDIDILSPHCPLRDILFRTSIPLAWLLNKVGQFPEAEEVLLELLRKGVYLDEIRISKKGSIHAACDVFMTSVHNRCWKMCEEILHHAGSVIWKCLLAKHHSCHKHTYRDNTEDASATKTYPVVFECWQKLFNFAPLSTLKAFFEQGLNVIDPTENERLKKKLYPLLRDSTYKETLRNEHVLTQVASHHIESIVEDHVDFYRRSATTAVKLMIIFPKLITQVLNKLERSKHLCEWMSVIPRDEFSSAYQTCKKGWRTVKYLRDLTLDRKLLYRLVGLGVSTLRKITNNQASLLHFVAILDDLDLLKAVTGSVDPVNICAEDKVGASPMEYAVAMGCEQTVEYLLKNGGSVTQQTLLAVCVGPKFVPFMQWKYAIPPRTTEEERRLRDLKALCSISPIDVSYRHPEFGNILQASMQDKQWQLVQFILESGKNISASVICDRSTLLPLLNHGPVKVCSLILDKHKEALKFDSGDLAKEAIFAASKRGTEPTALALLRSLLRGLVTEALLSDLVSWQDAHGMTAFHNVCQRENITFATFVLNELGKQGYEAVQHVVNTEDKSKCTPLWYALANKHWIVAELIVMHGGVVNVKRSVPDFWSKRLFSHENVTDSEIEGRQLQDTQLRRNDSTRVSECVSPRSKTFKDAYTKQTRTMPKKLPVSEKHVPKTIHRDRRKQKVQYLMELSQYCKAHSSSMIHGAAAVGDVDLLQEILMLTVSQHMTDLTSCPSPLVFAISNHQFKTLEILMRKISPGDSSLYEYLALAVLETSGFELGFERKERKKMKLKDEEKVCKDLLLELKERGDIFRTFQKLKTYIAPGRQFNEELISLVIKAALNNMKTPLCKTLMVALAHLGKPQPVQALQRYDHDSLKEILKSKILSQYTFTDLLFLLVKKASCDFEDDVRSRIEVLEYLTNDLDLTIGDTTVDYVVRMELYPMMQTVLNDYVKKNKALEPTESWLKTLYGSSKNGWINFVQTLTEKYFTHLTPEASSKSLCFACLHKRTRVVEYFLTRNPVLKERVENLTPLNRGTWVLDFAILGGSCEIVNQVLTVLDKKGTIDSFAFRDSMELAAKHASGEILETLIQSRMVSSVLTKDFVETLLLKTAARGQEKGCLVLLKSRYLDVRRTDRQDNSLLHYACMWNMMDLAETVLKDSKDELRSLNSFGHNPLDLARFMGNVSLSSHLVNKYRALPSQETGLVLTGWLRHLLTKNTSSSSIPLEIMPQHSLKKRHKLSLLVLVKSSDDNGTLAMVETAQETLVRSMKKSYGKMQLLHFCAKYGCKESLKCLIALIKTHAPEKLQEWLKSMSKPALVLAIENRHVACADVLLAENKCHEWTSHLKENILHVAARVGLADITEKITSGSPVSLFKAKDNSDLIPAATAVAFGNHHLLQYLTKDVSFGEDEHSAHEDRKHTCLLCLMDLSIGWSKIFQGHHMRQPLTPLRNVLDRTNFSIRSLKMIYDWSKISKSTDSLFAVLATMGYSADVVNAQLILINKNTDVMSKALASHFEEAACFYYLNNAGESQENVSELCLYAAQTGQNTFVRTVLQSMSYSDLISEDLPSPLEVAIAYGNRNLALDIEQRSVTDDFTTLKEIDPETLPVFTKWRTGLSHPGDDNWQVSVENTSARMSPADVLLTKSMDEDYKKIIESNAAVESMIPKSFSNKDINVDIGSFRQSIPAFSDVQIRALIMSKLILGRYTTAVDRHSHSWNSVTRINVACIPNGSAEKPDVSLSGLEIRDKVKISESPAGVQVLTGDMPNALTEDAIIREYIEQTVIEEMEDLAKEELGGLSLKITVDWDSLKALKEKEQVSHVFRMLTGDVANNRLGGLHGVILKCGSLLRDIESLCGKKAANSTQMLYSNLTEVNVKYTPSLPIIKSTSLIPKVTSMVWYFSMKDYGLHYNSDHFPLLKMLMLFRHGYSSLTQGFRLLTGKMDDSEPCVDPSKYDYEKRVRKRFTWYSTREFCVPQLVFRKVNATIEWESFESIGIVTKVDAFIRKYAVPELLKIGHLYMSMPWLYFDIDDVCLRVTRMKERSGMWLKRKTLVVSMRVTRTDTGEWLMEDTDYSKFMYLTEEKQILDQVPPQTFEYPKSAADLILAKSSKAESLTSSEKLAKAENVLQDKLGIMVTINRNDTEWLKIIHKEDSKEMSHPLHLIGRYHDWLAFDTWHTFSHAVQSALQSSLVCRYLGSFDIIAGGWSWLTINELKDVRTSKILLVKLSNPKKKNQAFQTMTLSEIQDLNLRDVVGIWQHVSFSRMLTDNVSDVKRVQLVSIDKKLIFLCDKSVFKLVLQNIPRTVSIKPRTDAFKKGTIHDGEMGISSNDLVCHKGYYHEKQNTCQKKELLSFLLRSKYDNISVVYDVWNAGQKLGTHIVFDSEDFYEDLSLKLVGYIMQKTLGEIADLTKGIDRNKDAVLSAFLEIGLIRIGFQHAEKSEKTIEKVEGNKYSETADISLLSETVLHINFKPSILDPDRELKPITETLISAICCSFEVQTPFMMSDTLAKTLNNDIDPENVSVFQFHSRKDKESVLSAAVQSRENFFAAVRSIAEKQEESDRYRNAKEKLSELTSLQFKDRCYMDGSVVGYANGDMRYWVFKSDGDVASKSEIEEDLLDALEGRTPGPERFGMTNGGSNLPLLQTEDLFPDNGSVLTVSSPQRVRRELPKIQRLRRPTATSSLAVRKATERLFDFVEIGHTGNIENVMDVGANINAKDAEGRTPLVRAAELRNYVLQNLLLSYGADATKSDKMGRTALHMESAHGDVESMKLLLTHGAKVNAKDKNGRTPLHYAVNKKQIEAVDILVFCGGDVTIKDKIGNDPTYQSRSPQMSRLMQESRQTVFGIKNKYVFIEHTKLEADTTYHLKKLGLTIKTPPSIGTGSVNFIGRRVRPEYSRSSLVPSDKELLMSDVFEYRLSGTRPEGHVILKIPVYAKPDLFEEVYMKTDRGVYSNRLRDIRYAEDTKEWFCYVKMNIANINAFLLVTLPKVEKFPVTPEGGVFTSAVDSMVEIKIQKNTFTKSGSLTLEVIPKPAFDEEEFSPVLSLSHFYDVKHSKGEQPKRDVEFTMPIPQDYFGDGDLYVMLRHEEADYMEEEECWEILERNPDISNGLITVGVSRFSDVNVIEYKQPKEDGPVPEQEIIRANAKLLEKAKRRECSVVFMAMLRPTDNSNCEAVVECTRNTRLHNRLHHWKTEGYKDQKPSFTSEFITFPKQEFNFDLGGNSQKVNNVVTKLQYHPKRENFLTFPICAKDELKDKVGWVDIGEKKRLEKEFAENPNYDSLAKILVYLAEYDRKPTMNGDAAGDEAEFEEAKAFEGFTDKYLLQKLASSMGTEWMRIGILLGFPRASLEKLRDQEDLEDIDKRLKILTRWRDRRLHRSDHGVPELLIALQKCGRKDLVTMVINELKKWLDDKKERRDKFYSWLEKVLTGSNIQASGLLEPMSDDFLQALVVETGVVLDLASDIDVSRPEVDDILADPLTPTDQAKMLKVLQTSREKQDTRGHSFRVLTEGLTSYGLNQPRNWALRTAREWINNTELSDDPFVHAINDYLEEAETLYLKQRRRDGETDNSDNDNRDTLFMDNEEMGDEKFMDNKKDVDNISIVSHEKETFSEKDI